MRKPVYLLISSCLLMVLVSACALTPAAQVAATSAPQQLLATQAAPATAVQPTSTPVPPTETSLPPTATHIPGPAIMLDQIHMLNAHDGWGWATQSGQLSQLLRTSDGGQTWSDVSPKLGTFSYYGSFFLNAQAAWLTYYDSTANVGGLLNTKDGGQTWVNLPPNQYLQNARVEFTSLTDGSAETADMGAGQAHLTYYQTKDGGNTWNLIAITAPSPEDGLPVGTLHLCNICGDVLYYDPARVIIAQGDMANDPVGVVRLSVSADMGAHWSSLQIPIPGKYAGGSVAPLSPVFFGQAGLLPVNIVKYAQDGSVSLSALVFYTSQDGGQNWQTAPAMLENPHTQLNTVQILSAKDAFVVCGQNLCSTNDGAQTWKTLPASLNFDQSTGAADAVTQFNFIDPANGWAISGQSGASSLWHSTDGGSTWVKMSPTLNQ